jgi:hypothetical protein
VYILASLQLAASKIFMEIKEIEYLLNTFSTLPKSVEDRTYLEICKYPRRRFEEICSRILCFYFAPNNEHKFGDLFLRSLFNLLAPDKEFNFLNKKIHILSEDNADGKRLDILIYTDTFVVGIENKITAGLNNPLDVYKNRIHQYGTENVYRVVLSLRKLSSRDDLALIVTNGFTNFTYSQYFDQIQQNLHLYKESCSEKYLLYLYDFIETLSKMTDNTILNEQLANYFFDNAEKIDSLITLFNQFNNKTRALQIERISVLKEKISELTKNDKWWAWESWDLGINEFYPNCPKIGIESFFEATKGDPFGIFKIMITAWSLKDWSYYEEILLKDYRNFELQKIDNRAFLYVEIIQNPDDSYLLEKLKKYFDYLMNLTSDYRLIS